MSRVGPSPPQSGVHAASASTPRDDALDLEAPKLRTACAAAGTRALPPGSATERPSSPDDDDGSKTPSLVALNGAPRTWIKGEPMPDKLVDDIVRGLGIERLTDEQRVVMGRQLSQPL